MKLFILAILATACGTEGAAPLPAVFEQQTAQNQQALSMVVDSLDDLPQCSDVNERQLVYAEDEEQFLSCRRGEWRAVNLPAQTQQTEVQTSPFWRDPETGTVWHVVGVIRYKVSYGHGEDLTHCGFYQDITDLPKIYTAPTPEQRQQAIRNGLFGQSKVRVFVDLGMYVNSDDPATIHDGQGYWDHNLSAFLICPLRKP
jgi:hypothetical protein